MSFLIVTALCALVPLPEMPKPKVSIEGSWEIQSLAAFGLPTEIPADSRVRVFRDGKTYITIDGKETEASAYSLGAGNPPAIDSGATGNTPSKGIYSISGDELRICYGFAGQPRPTEFASTAQSKTILMVFKRVKP